MPRKNSETLAPGYADDYIDYDDIEYCGFCDIFSSGVNGECIIASNETDIFKAWIVNTENGAFVVTVLYPSDYSSDSVTAIENVLSSLKIFLKLR